MREENFPSLKTKGTFKWKELYQYFLMSVEFLTIIPVRSKLKNEKKVPNLDLSNSLLFFPVAGLIIGSLLFVFYLIFKSYFPSEITSTFILGLWVYLTGGLHIDGLADTLDGLCGGKGKKEILDIMKDTHIGAKGVAGIIVLILLKLFLINGTIFSSIPQSLIYIPIVSRWGMVTGCYLIPCAREQGMGHFFSSPEYHQIIGATLITVVSGVFLMGILFLTPLMATGALCLGWSFYLKKKIGGFTGDTLGALNEIGEVVGLLFISL